MCAWGFTENGERALVCVRLGAREAKDDWLELGRDLATRGLQAPRLIVADGAPGLTLAIEELWPRADRQHCAVHRLRNLQAKLPKSEHDRIRFNYWSGAHRRDQRQGRQAPPPGPHLRAQTRRLRVRRSAASQTTSTPWSCTCATRSGTATMAINEPARDAHSARSAGAPKSSAGSPARPAASRSSGPCSTCSSATPATAPPSPTSTANTSTASSTNRPNRRPSTRRYPPPRLTNGNLNRERIYSAQRTRALRSARQRPGVRVTPFVPKAAASRAGEGGRRSAVGPADPRVQPEHRQGLMTISMPDRFRFAARRGRRRRIGGAMGLLEQSRLASCPRPGRTESTPLTWRRIAVWRLVWPPRVARARRDGRDGSCASGRPRDVGHRCERWRALERERGAAFEPPLASQVLLGIKQLERNGQVLLRRPDCVRGDSGPPGVGGFAIRVLRRRRGRRRVSACCAVAGATLSRRARRHSC